MSETKPANKLSLLKKKTRATKTINVVVDGDAGTSVELTFQAIPGAMYDLLVGQCPPSPIDKKQGLNFNMAKFAPKLIAASLIDPEVTEDEAKELWENENWNRGERMQLFSAAVEVSSNPLTHTKRG